MSANCDICGVPKSAVDVSIGKASGAYVAVDGVGETTSVVIHVTKV